MKTKFLSCTKMGGRDFPIDYFAARNLDEICEKVNDIWYFGDRYPADLEGFFVNETVYDDNAKKLLLEITTVPLKRTNRSLK